jgi:hypothetical protein
VETRKLASDALSNPDPDPIDSFGWSVAVWGDKVVVGAPGDGVGADDGVVHDH